MNPENKAALEAWVRETGIQLVQVNGQRKYGGPPPGTVAPAPALAAPGCPNLDGARLAFGGGACLGPHLNPNLHLPHLQAEEEIRFCFPSHPPSRGRKPVLTCMRFSTALLAQPRNYAKDRDLGVVLPLTDVRSPLPCCVRGCKLRAGPVGDNAPPYVPSPGWVGSPPPAGSEVFIGRLPQDVYEHQLIPLFQRVGRLYEFRLMMTFSGLNRGFAYARYSSRRGAQAAIATLHNHPLRPSCPLLVCRSTEKCELSVDGLPPGLSHQALLLALRPLGPGLQEALLLPSPGPALAQMALLKFSSHRAAAMAKKALVEGRAGSAEAGACWSLFAQGSRLQVTTY